MQKLKYVDWQDADMYFGYLEDYPDYWTQAESLDELRENLADLFRDFTGGDVQSFIRSCRHTSMWHLRTSPLDLMPSAATI